MRAVENADGMFAAHVTTLVAKIDSIDEAQASQKIADAKESIELISKQLNGSSKEFSEAADALLAAKKEESDKRAALEAFEPHVKELSTTIDSCRTKMKQTEHVLVKFKEFVER